MHEVAAKKGDFTLFGLFMRADAPGTWDLVVSAPWLEDGKLKATGELVELLSESLGEESLKRLSRIATVDADQPSVKLILKAFAVDDGELRVQNTDLFGLRIDEAIIFRAKAPQPERRNKPHATAGASRGRR